MKEIIKEAVLGCGVLALAGGGCSGSKPTSSGLSGELELFSWWTHVGEKDGLGALETAYTAQHPNVQIVTATVNADGTTHPSDATDLVSRLAANKPPDTFQQDSGPQAWDAWVTLNGTNTDGAVIEPLDELFAAKGFNTAYYPFIIQKFLSYGGHPWLVPVNVHRINTLYYNKKIFVQYNLTPPATMDDFFAAADKLKASLPSDVYPVEFTSATPWLIGLYFTDSLVARTGGQYYSDFIAGLKSADDPEVRQALVDTAHILSYLDPNQQPPPSSVTEYDVGTKVASGAAAMFLVPDWVVANIKAQGFTVDVDFGEVPAPGTGAYYQMMVDAFALPKGALHRDNALAWLSLVGSKTGQNLFNPKKDTIPPQPITQQEAMASGYDAFELQKLKDFAAANATGSVLADGRFCWFPVAFTALWDALFGTFFTQQTSACLATNDSKSATCVSGDPTSISSAVQALRQAYPLLQK